jgi:hypothetical protein
MGQYIGIAGKFAARLNILQIRGYMEGWCVVMPEYLPMSKCWCRKNIIPRKVEI